MDSSQPGSSIPGILQARILEWVAISFSNACTRAMLLQSYPTVRPHGQQPTRLLYPWDSPGIMVQSPAISYSVEVQAGLTMGTLNRTCESSYSLSEVMSKERREEGGDQTEGQGTEQRRRGKGRRRERERERRDARGNS